MGSKAILSSLILLGLPMMAIPGIALKIPPMYQLLLVLAALMALLNITMKGVIKREFLIYSTLLLVFDVYLYLNGSNFSQIISITTYIVILLVLIIEYPKTIYFNRKKIYLIFSFLYFYFMGYALLQVIANHFYEIEYLIDYRFYLTSELYSTNPSPPNTGWNAKFRPSSFFAEPSFLGFYVALYSLYRIDSKLKFPIVFLLANIVFLHLIGSRSGEVILICMLLYISFEKIFSVKSAKIVFFLSVLSIFIFASVFLEDVGFLNLSNSDGSTIERVNLVLIGLKIFSQNIFFGIGLGNIGDFAVHNELYNYSVSNLTNMYLQILSETGVIGFLILIIFFKKFFSYSYCTIGLLISFFFFGGYALFFVFLFPLFITINFKESQIENLISK